MNHEYQFSMKINFHFSNMKNSDLAFIGKYGVFFGVWEDLKRKVPLEIEGIEGLNTVYMLFDEAKLYRANETTIVKCDTIAPGLYKEVIKVGNKGELWESGYFADVVILEVNYDNF